LQKNFHPGLIKAGARKHANKFHALVLLRYRRKRPCRRRAAYQLDEFPPPHVPSVRTTPCAISPA